MGGESGLINLPHPLLRPGQSHEGVTASNFLVPDGVWSILLLLARGLLPPPAVSNLGSHPYSPLSNSPPLPRTFSHT